MSSATATHLHDVEKLIIDWGVRECKVSSLPSSTRLALPTLVLCRKLLLDPVEVLERIPDVERPEGSRSGGS